MHPLSFQLKRAHNRCLAFGRPLTVPVGVTMARFDLLFFVHGRTVQREGRPRPSYEPSPPKQVEICKALGVTAATISRMLDSLEQLGLVSRADDPDDARCKLVSLTDAGLTRVRLMLRKVLRRRFFEDVFEQIFQRANPILTFIALEGVHAEVRSISTGLGDVSTLKYGGRDPVF